MREMMIVLPAEYEGIKSMRTPIGLSQVVWD